MKEKTLDDCLAEVDRWKAAAAARRAKMTPAQQAAHYERIMKWYETELARIRQAKAERKRKTRSRVG